MSSGNERIVVAVAADHAGYELKGRILEHLGRRADVEVRDFGPPNGDRVDYPDFARKIARAVQGGEIRYGVLVCGTGIGMAIACNKYRGVRAAALSDHFSARMARAHNDAQVLCIGARVVGEGTALELVEAFLGTEFEGGRHADRIASLHEAED
jgi:ribose 5-phosphate isomerase B